MLKSALCIAISFFFFSCTIRDKKPESPVYKDPYESAFNMIKEGQSLLKDGDLVTRNNQDFSSQFIKQFNRHDKSYSHSGIVFFENGYPYVFHILPGDENPGGKLRKDSLIRFCDPRKNFGYGIFRYSMDTSELKDFKKEISHWYDEGIEFDSTFNLKTDKKMYCSEMIKKALERSTNDRIHISTTAPTMQEARFFSKHLHLSLNYAKNLQVVTIDNLFLNPHCTSIKRFDFTSHP